VLNTKLKLRKAPPERLRSIGLDEAWLQNEIANDTSLLGLGPLTLLKKEKTLNTGGRIDFVMADVGGETRYEIEVMLGETDPSHIIRTIEYWDTERQRYHEHEHRAVIVAELITSRFFNVIRLLNRAVPLIAIQLSAFRFGDEVVLQFTRVLDFEPTGEQEDDEAEQVDRSYWEKKTKPEAWPVFEAISSLIPAKKDELRITYNKLHIAIGTNGYNFCWFHPRKAPPYWVTDIKVGAEKRQEVIDRLADTGIEADSHGRSSVRLRLDAKGVQEQRDLVAEIFREAEELSRH
jgi:hypothetical protein